MSKYSSYFYTAVVVVLTGFMLINPRETVAAASFGFQLWYTTVFPALFPFFIAAELLVGLGFAQVLGLLFEPVMRPVFNLPGCSSLVLIMGFTSGFPVGAILTRNLYEKQMLTAEEAERLVSFTNNSSPLFIVGAVGVGMFGNPLVGYLLALAHYGSNILLGIFWGLKKSPPRISPSRRPGSASGIEPRDQESEPVLDSIGKILGTSVNKALHNILAVGGFIVIFSVLTRMLSHWGCIDLIAVNLVKLFSVFNLTYPLAYGLGMGFFEITLGAKTVVAANSPELLPALLTVSAILGFSGLSIIAQVMSIVAGLPIRISFYVLTRLAQVMLSLAIIGGTYRFFLADAVSTVSLPSLPVYKLLYCCNMWSLSLYCMAAGLFLILLILGAAWYKKI
ncbi:MAG: sporulation integral membrane protein YlbJ [Syntrophomonadaceae bacterium]|nr:sporulation integral membrane protein YlbJ [Syntrophomonadaceae bacterium]